ncbi:MAG TPA: DNA polymerase III subunit alpha [Rhodanobacteraceae bacterium]|nr:DNA polymerase III subunit alpha [Rhodanobacteraceae bacterium]
MPANFVHLHVHSEYSLVDSTIRIKALVEACARMGVPALALTDDSNLFGLVKFYKAAKAAGIKPIAGCEVWVAGPGEEPTRLTLLCANRDGYLNLSRLVSQAWLSGQRNGRAVVEANRLTELADGLIALVGRNSAVAIAARDGHADSARQRLDQLSRSFPQRLYLELTRCGRADEEAWNQAALRLAAEIVLPVVASNDARFLAADDFEAHEARVCIQHGRVLADPRRPRDYSPEQYLKSPEAMHEAFADIPEAIENGIELARRCNLTLEFGTYYLPEFPLPDGHDLASFIRERARTGLAERLQAQAPATGHTRADYDQRLDTEVDVIVKMGFPGYFLIVSDFIGWAKQNGIPVGPGRGSGAGSVVAWALGITDLDPLRFGLLFERFLNPERVSMPDFDVDFCMDRRDEVIDYVARKYGRDHVSQIITYGSMAARAVLRDCGRVLGMSYGHVDRIAKLIPSRPLDLTLSDALGRSEKSRQETDRVVQEFCALHQDDDDARALIDLALKLEGLARNAGKHAGGVVIAPAPLTEFAPLYAEAGGSGVVTQYDKDDVEAVGLVKFDFLGLRTLTIIDWAVKAINQRRAGTGADPINIDAIPLDDPAVFKLLQKARTVAVFQFESAGMQRLLKDAKPDRFEDLIALVSLFRPGPMDLIPSFVARKHGEEEVVYPDPRVEPILRETYGIMVYQEQVMQMAQIIGGYSLGGADLLRRAMGKKKVSEMVKQRATFRDGAAKNGLDEAKADAIFDLMEKFAGYGFNKSHAAAYALVSYQTAWLKVHYPAEFMAATLSADMDSTDKVVGFLNDTRALGITVLPPDVNASDYPFVALDPGTIRYGLGAIKGVGRGACEAIVAARDGGYRDLGAFCRRVDSARLNKRVLEALIAAGATDSLGNGHRAALGMLLPEAMRAAEQAARDRESGQADIFGGAISGGGDNTPLPLPQVPELPLEQRLAGERDTLGHYLSGHPTDPWRNAFAALTTCPLGEIETRLPANGNGANRRRPPEFDWTVGGMLGPMRRQGDNRLYARLEDGSGQVEVLLADEVLEHHAELMQRDAMLIIEGRLRYDSFLDGYLLRARQLWPIDTAISQHASLLRLKLGEVNGRFIDLLRDTLGAWRGSTPVLLAGYRNGSARTDLRLSDEWRVRATPELKRALEGLPGIENAEILFARPNAG